MASVAKWLAHLPFTSKVAGSSLSENFSMWLEPSPHVKRVKVNSTLCRKSWVLSGYSGFLPQGTLTGWVRHIGQGGRSLMRYGLIAAAQAPFVSSKSTSVCFTYVSPVLSIYSECNQSLKSPDRECAVKYLYLTTLLSVSKLKYSSYLLTWFGFDQLRDGAKITLVDRSENTVQWTLCTIPRHNLAA
jgi:hypothetical protein